ncbi:ATP-binding cassette domain-containing protein [Paenibacillus sp. N3.4]|uniref:ATP-binding cassette domain-containing protein n=1 Tax=Paenibacillus sp. N3.4 TaxID=2603222 RepID=UPI00164FA2A1|nr:ATP-binding cassette domain-containing protein [Paenibacillus sp. N3.4]
METDGFKAISIRGVTKSLDTLQLGPMDLEIEPGYIIAVVGPNGSGKSSLFRLLMNLNKPDRGDIHLHGKSYAVDEVAIKQAMGYVPEVEEWNDSGCRP